MTEFDNDRLAELNTFDNFSTPTAEIQEWIETYGSERDALNVALAKLQELSAWMIGQERCPDCFGDTLNCDVSVDNIHVLYAECLDCGEKWNSIGKKFDPNKWKQTKESELLDGWEK